MFDSTNLSIILRLKKNRPRPVAHLLYLSAFSEYSLSLLGNEIEDLVLHE